MKQKYKSPEMMQQRGVDFHTKFLKKAIKAMIASEEKPIQPFFYHTEFDFGEGQEPHPVLYIGEIPAKWKKYLKTNKTSTTFAYGDCVIDAEGLLKMQVTMGKGGKELILKKINKVLLKPFCKAYLVEDINTEGVTSTEEEASSVTSEVEEKEAPIENAKTEDKAPLEMWANTTKDFLNEANSALQVNLKILNEFEKPMSQLKNIVVTDNFIDKAMKAKTEIKDLDPFVFNLENLKKLGKSYKGESKDVDNLLLLLSKQIQQINDNKAKIDLMIKNMEGLKKIANPEEAEIPIIDDDPIVNFLNRNKKVYM